MTNEETAELKKLLSDEMVMLERELSSVGRINPDNPEDWEPSMNTVTEETAELEGRASEITDFEDRSAVEFELEGRYRELKNALERMEHGVYGVCHVCKNEIEIARLKANPAARTCKEHRESK